MGRLKYLDVLQLFSMFGLGFLIFCLQIGFRGTNDWCLEDLADLSANLWQRLTLLVSSLFSLRRDIADL